MQRQWDAPLFTIWINGDTTAEAAGELTMGAIDPKYYPGRWCSYQSTARCVRRRLGLRMLSVVPCCLQFVTHTSVQSPMSHQDATCRAVLVASVKQAAN